MLTRLQCYRDSDCGSEQDCLDRSGVSYSSIRLIIILVANMHRTRLVKLTAGLETILTAAGL